MKLTKYEHACFTVQKDSQLLVVDPGGLSTDFIAPPNVVGVVITHKTVEPGDKLTVGMFSLEFFGGEHAEIHRSVPVIPNVGVLINDLIYYGGDSFILPKRPIDVLAVPAGAPWLKIGEAMDYMSAVKPRLAFPTHDAVLSDVGKEFADRLLAGLGERYGIQYTRLDAPIEI